MRVRSYFLIAGAVCLSAVAVLASSIFVEEWLWSRGRPLIPVAFPAIQNWNTLKITLDRTFCLGTCPDYTVTISGDGTVRYDGDRYVAVPGKHQTHISRNAVRKLFQEFEQVEFFSTFDSYFWGGTDQPTYTMTLSFDGHTKKVKDYGNAPNRPRGISDLEHAIDAAANTKLWVKGDGDVFAALTAENWNFRAPNMANSEILDWATEHGDFEFVKKVMHARSNPGVLDRSTFLTPKAD